MLTGSTPKQYVPLQYGEGGDKKKKKYRTIIIFFYAFQRNIEISQCKRNW